MSETIDKATDKVDTYTPDAGVDKSFNSLPEEATKYSDDGWEGITDEDGNIKVELHSETILRTLAERIYSDYNSAIRELYNNEARACRMARDQFHARPKIHITLNETDRKLVIHGIDSLGITKKIVGQVLRIVGKSSNMAGNEVGQFGMGFISYSLLTDMMILETNPRLGEEYALICDGGMLFRKAPQPNLGSYGTRLEMVLKDNIHLDELVKTFEACAQFSTIPTTIELETDITNNNYNYGREHESYQEGTYDCDQWDSIKDYVMEKSDVSDYLDDTYMKEVKDLDNNIVNVRSRRLSMYKEIHIDNEDYEFFGIIAFNQQRDVNMTQMQNRWTDLDDVPLTHVKVTGHSSKELMKVLLCKTPIITSKYEEHDNTSTGFDDIGGMCDYVLNIKDERKYMPDANRDTLSRPATKKLITNVVEDIITLLDEYNVDSVKDYNSSLTPAIYSTNASYIHKLLSRSTMSIIDMLDRRFPMTGNSYGSRIGDLISSGRKIIYLRSLRADVMGVLRKHFRPIEVVFIRNNNHYNNSLLEEFDILDGDVYKREHKLKASKDIVDSDGVTNNHVRLTVYSNGQNYNGRGFGRRRYKNKTSQSIGEINSWLDSVLHPDQFDVLIKAHGKATELERLVYEIARKSPDMGERILVVRHHRSIKAQTVNDIIDEVNKKEYMTTDGKMKGVEVLKHKHKINKGGTVDKFTSIGVCKNKNKITDYKSMTNNFTIITSDEKEMIKLWIAYNVKYQGSSNNTWKIEHNCNAFTDAKSIIHYLIGDTKHDPAIVKAFPTDTNDLSKLKRLVEERDVIAKTYDKDLIQLLDGGLKSIQNSGGYGEEKIVNKYKSKTIKELLQELLKEK